MGATGLDNNGFAIFPNYEAGMNALKQFLRDCVNGKLGQYNGTMSLEKFQEVYAPSSDKNDPYIYSETIAKEIGVTVDNSIIELI